MQIFQSERWMLSQATTSLLDSLTKAADANSFTITCSQVKKKHGNLFTSRSLVEHLELVELHRGEEVNQSVKLSISLSALGM